VWTSTHPLALQVVQHFSYPRTRFALTILQARALCLTPFLIFLLAVAELIVLVKRVVVTGHIWDASHRVVKKLSREDLTRRDLVRSMLSRAPHEGEKNRYLKR